MTTDNGILCGKQQLNVNQKIQYFLSVCMYRIYIHTHTASFTQIEEVDNCLKRKYEKF